MVRAIEYQLEQRPQTDRYADFHWNLLTDTTICASVHTSELSIISLKILLMNLMNTFEKES